MRFAHLLDELPDLRRQRVALGALGLGRLLLLLVSVVPHRLLGHAHFKALLQSAILAAVPGHLVDDAVLVPVGGICTPGAGATGLRDSA